MADDRTQFLIELAAKFSGGDSAVATVATLGDRMLAAGATAKDFESATKATTSALEDAAEAAKHANDAVAAGEKSYAATEAAADKAAKMVEQLGARATELTGKLQAALDVGDAKSIARAEKQIWAFAQRQDEAVGRSNAAAAALKSEAAALDVLNSKAATATAKHADLNKGLGNVKAAADKAAKAQLAASGTGKVNEMAEAFGKLGGPAGIAGQKILGVATGFSKLRVAMGTAGPYLAIAVAIVAIASAAFIAAVGITKWGVSLADANRTQGLLMDGIARSSEGGAELAATIDRLGTIVPSTREELMGMAKGLADAGLRGKALSTALETAAVKAAKLKFGPDFQAQMLSLDFQSKRFSENIAATFGGLKIDPLLEGIQTLGALFDASTESGRALKFLFEALFQPLVDGATGVIPAIERMFLYAEILALKAYIALKPYSGAIKALGTALLIGAAIIGGTLAVAVALVVVNFLALIAAIGALGFALYKIIEVAIAVGVALVKGLGQVVVGFVDIGRQMVEGLVKGITGAGAAVYDAMAGVVNGAIDGAKKLLGIASPSAVFADIGSNTAAGFSEGVEDGADAAQGSLAAMVAPPASAGAGGSRAGGGLSLSIGQVIVQGENGEEQAHDFIDQITKWLEGEGVSIGGGEVPA
jgi:hypothetical protein